MPEIRTHDPAPGSAPVRSDSRQEAEDALRRLSRLQDERRPFDAIWEEVAEHMGPAYQGFSSEPRHPRQPRYDIVDSTARRAAKVFSAGMLSGVSSPAQRWFSLAMDEEEDNQAPEAKAWLQELEKRYYAELSRCGFYPQQHLAYHQSGLFGWQALYLDEDLGSGVRCLARPLREIYVAENHLGAVDTVYRLFTLTARQAEQKWGRAALSEPLKRCLDRDRAADSTRFSFLHAVFPREDRDSRRLDQRGMAFASLYVDVEARRVISRGGYREAPYIVTRAYRLPGAAYSYSPGSEALADVKMINEMKRLILEAGQLSVAPPYLAPDDGFLGRVSFAPRALNYYRRGEGATAGDFAPLHVGGDPRFAMDLLAATRQDINEAFFVDLFLAIKGRIEAGAAPTASEVAELAGERMFLLGPMLMQQQQENFSALFERLFALKQRRGELPPIPASLRGKRFKAEYQSPLALAQREAGARAVLAGYDQVGRIAALAPEVLDLLDHEAMARAVLENSGAPACGLRTRAQVALARAGRARDQAQAAPAQALASAASVLPKLSKAPEAGSPAAALLAGLGLGPGPARGPKGA